MYPYPFLHHALQDIVAWEQRDGDNLYIHLNLNCKSSSQAVSRMCVSHLLLVINCHLTSTHTPKSIVIGPAGHTIQKITAEAKRDIEELLKCSVDLVLNVRAQKA